MYLCFCAVRIVVCRLIIPFCLEIQNSFKILSEKSQSQCNLVETVRPFEYCLFYWCIWILLFDGIWAKKKKKCRLSYFYNWLYLCILYQWNFLYWRLKKKWKFLWLTLVGPLTMTDFKYDFWLIERKLLFFWELKTLAWFLFSLCLYLALEFCLKIQR